MRQGSILRKLGVLLAVGLAAGVVTDVAAAHNVRFGGTLTAQFNGETNVFKGRLRSSNDRCESGRRVAVFRVKSGPDLRVASDRTDSLGRWQVVYNARAGNYYAKVMRRDIGSGDHNHICIGIQTATFDIPPRCGNGKIEAGEACDDGNMANGDGCDNACQVEGPLAQLVAKERDAGPKAPCSVRRFASGSA